MAAGVPQRVASCNVDVDQSSCNEPRVKQVLVQAAPLVEDWPLGLDALVALLYDSASGADLCVQHAILELAGDSVVPALGAEPQVVLKSYALPTVVQNVVPVLHKVPTGCKHKSNLQR